MKKPINLFMFQLAVSVFFIVLGTMGVLPNVDEGVYSLRYTQWGVELAVGIVELLCGAVLLFGLFASPRKKTLRLASTAIFIFWAARLVFTRFVIAGVLSTAVSSVAAFLNWLLVLSTEIIILLAVLLIARRYED
ncbi:hypothetical protein MASR2M78_22620 [Treponema sp.]